MYKYIHKLTKVTYYLCSYVQSRKKTGIIVKFEIPIDITSYPLNPS